MIKLLEYLLRFAFALTEHLRLKGALEAGRALAILKGLEHAKIALHKAKIAKDKALSDFDNSNGVLDESDPNLRD